MPRGTYVRTPEIRARLSASNRAAASKVNSHLQAERQGVVYRALPGTIPVLMERTGMSYGSVRKYLRILERLGVAEARKIHNRYGYGYAFEYHETEVRKGT